jgi:hypothetical protein
MKYRPRDHQKARIEAAFTSRPPADESQIERYGLIRNHLKALAHAFTVMCPHGRELNSAIKCLEEAQSWAIAAIARNE